MANDPNTLVLNVEAKVDKARKEFQLLEEVVKKNQQTFEKLGQITNSIKSLPKSGQKATQSFRGLTAALKKSTDPFGMVQKQITGYQKALDSIQSRMSRKSMLGQDTLKETGELKRLTTNITAYSKAIKSNKYLKELSASQDQQMASAKNTLAQAEQEQTQLLERQAQAQRDLAMILDPVKAKMAELNEKLNSASQNFVNLKMAGENTKGVERNIKRIQKEMEKLKNSTKKASNSWKVLLGRIKNIAIYRTIRTALHWLTSGIQEGVDNLVQYDKSSNDTLSNLNASLKQIKNTMGIAFMSVLRALEPAINSLADALIDLINSFNLAIAKMQGEDTYTKAKRNVDDYAKSLQKVKKFSFDAFESLSGSDNKTSPTDMFEEGSVAEDTTELSKTLEKVLSIIKSITTAVGKIIKLLLNSGILDAILSVANVIGLIVDTILNLLGPAIESIIGIVASVVQQIAGVVQFIIGIINLLTLNFDEAWKNIGNGFANLVNGIVNMFIRVVNFIIDAINLLFIKLNPIFWLLEAFGVHAEIPHIEWSMNWQPFADGGFTTANYIAMNENGKREWVGKNAGSTAIVNDTQMSDIMYQAVRQGCFEGVAEAMFSMPNSSDEREIILSVDKETLGKVVASSSGFKSEAIRIGIL